MNVYFVRLGAKNKYNVLHEFLKEYKLNESEVAYFGDDIIDVEVLKFVAYSYAPNDACAYVKDIVNTVTNSNSGEGVLREIIDRIINNNQKLKSALKSNYKPCIQMINATLAADKRVIIFSKERAVSSLL